MLARRLGMDTEDVRREVERAGRGARDAPAAAVEREVDDAEGAPIIRVTMRSLPRVAEVALERDALMGFLQFGHRLDPELRRQAVDLPFRHPALDAVRSAVAAAPDMDRPGWAADAVGTVREPFRSLAAELLTADFPARDDDHAAVASASDLARRLIARMVDQEKSELLGAIQRVPPDSDEGRRIRIRLRELDAQRQRLVLDS